MDDLLSRISIVLERQDFRMCVPPNSDDTDIVLEECRDAIESLRQQLAEKDEEILKLNQMYPATAYTLYIEKQLAAALAACEAKNRALNDAADVFHNYAELHSLKEQTPENAHKVERNLTFAAMCDTALAIKPDASTLKAHDEAEGSYQVFEKASQNEE